MRDRTWDIVCIHGAGGGGWEWAIWARVLAARGHAVLAADLRAVGGGLEATRYADYRDQVLDWLHGRCGDRPTLLLGASLGGLLAIDVAGRSRASALALVNPMPPAPFCDGMPARDWPDRIRWGSERHLAGTRASMGDVDDAACLYAFLRWRDESGAVLRDASAGLVLPPPALPSWVLTSGADTDVPPGCSVATAGWLDATRVDLPSASHLGPLFGAAAAPIAEQLADWLDSREQTAPNP